MNDGQATAQKPAITVTEMNGRIEELERQRNDALTRCATLSGTNALLRQALGEAQGIIEVLSAPGPSHQHQLGADRDTSHGPEPALN